MQIDHQSREQAAILTDYLSRWQAHNAKARGWTALANLSRSGTVLSLNLGLCVSVYKSTRSAIKDPEVFRDLKRGEEKKRRKFKTEQPQGI